MTPRVAVAAVAAAAATADDDDDDALQMPPATPGAFERLDPYISALFQRSNTAHAARAALPGPVPSGLSSPALGSVSRSQRCLPRRRAVSRMGARALDMAERRGDDAARCGRCTARSICALARDAFRTPGTLDLLGNYTARGIPVGAVNIDSQWQVSACACCYLAADSSGRARSTTSPPALRSRT